MSCSRLLLLDFRTALKQGIKRSSYHGRFINRRHFVGLVPQPRTEDDIPPELEDIPDVEDLPSFEELEEAEGTERLSRRKARQFQKLEGAPKALASGDGKSEQLVKLDFRDFDETVNRTLPVGFEKEFEEAEKELMAMSEEEYENLPDFNMSPEDAALSKIPPWHFPNWVEPTRDPEHVAKYSSFPEFFKDEIAEYQKQIDERREKRKKRTEIQALPWWKDPHIIDSLKYASIFIVFCYFIWKRRHVIRTGYEDPKDVERNERIMKLGIKVRTDLDSEINNAKYFHEKDLHTDQRSWFTKIGDQWMIMREEAKGDTNGADIFSDFDTETKEEIIKALELETTV